MIQAQKVYEATVIHALNVYRETITQAREIYGALMIFPALGYDDIIDQARENCDRALIQARKTLETVETQIQKADEEAEG